MNKKIFFSSLFLSSILLLGGGCGASSITEKSTAEQKSGTTYSSSKYNFSIQLPEGWSAEEKEFDGAQMSFLQNIKIDTPAGSYQPNVLLFTEPDQNSTTASYIEFNKNNWIKDGAKIITESRAGAAGDDNQGKIIEYSLKIPDLDNVEVDSYALIMHKQGNFYIFLATVPAEKYNEFRPVFANMLLTVK